MGQNILDTYDFSATAGNGLSTVANWVNNTLSNQWNDLKISTPNGGCMQSSGQCGDYRTGQTWTNDQFAEWVLATLPLVASARLYVRLSGDGGNNPNSGYAVGPDPNISGQAYRLFDVSTGQLAASATTATAGDTVNIEVVGSIITVRVNGSILSDLTYDDSAGSNYTTGNPGGYINDAIAKATTWKAGSVTGAGIAIPILARQFRERWS